MKPALVALYAALAVSFALLTARGFGETGPASVEATVPSGHENASPPPTPLYAMLRELSRLEVLPLRPRWEMETGGGQVRLALDGSRLYIASSTDAAGSSLYCTDTGSGAVIWSRTLDSWISCPPSVWEGIIYVGTTSRTLYALDAASGAVLWSFTAQGEIITPPVVDSGVLLFFADNNAVFGLSNRLYALDPGGGALLWSYDTASWTPSPPATGHGLVYTAGSTSTVQALEINSGRERWSSPVDSVVFSSPLLNGDRVYVTTVNGRLYSLDALTGSRLWEVVTYHFTPSVLRLAGENLLLDRCPDRVLAISPRDGRPLWDLGGDALLASGSWPANRAYVYYPLGRLLELEAGSGGFLRLYVAGFDFAHRPLVNDGWVYCTSSDGKVRACPLSGAPTAR